MDGIGTTLSVGFENEVTRNQIAELLVSVFLRLARSSRPREK